MESWSIRSVAERVRQSLFVIPAAGVIGGALTGVAVSRLDRAGAGEWLPVAYDTPPDNARSMLTAITTGTLTVVTLLLTFTLVAIQLASSQRSPRTIVNFLGDRFQQATIAIVLATGVYGLVALQAVPDEVTADVTPPDLTVIVAVLATLASMTALVLSVDRTARRLSVGTLVRELADETTDLARRRFGGERHGTPVDVDLDDELETLVCSTVAGWIQFVDEQELAAALPDGAAVEIVAAVGSFVMPGGVLLRTDATIDDETDRALAGAVVVGEERTMQQDVAYGLVRLNDIALRALSPGVNDPNTAREVALRLGAILLVLHEYELDAPAIELDGHHIGRRGVPDHDSLAHAAFDQVRRAADDDIATLQTLEDTLRAVRDEVDRRDLQPVGSGLLDQLDAVEKRLQELPGGRRRPGATCGTVVVD